MNKYKLSFVKNEEKISQAGKKYISLSVKVEGDPEDRWYNGWGNEYTKTWNVGDVVALDLYEEEYQGKTYHKVRPLSKTDMLGVQVQDLEKRVAALEFVLSKTGSVGSASPVTPASTPSTPSSTPASAPAPAPFTPPVS